MRIIVLGNNRVYIANTETHISAYVQNSSALYVSINAASWNHGKK